MPYRLFYHPKVKEEDLVDIPNNIKQRLRRAIEQRLLSEPAKYGDPLRRDLRGYRKLRMGDYRIIYRIDNDRIVILKIGQRKEVYRKAQLRLRFSHE